MIPDLTLEKLVRIVAETVEQVIRRQRLVLAAYAFCEGNRDELAGLMRSVNGNGEFYTDSDAFPNGSHLPDVLFIDVLPACYVPKLALGISEAGFADFFNRVLWADKKIVVMRRETVQNTAVGSLFDNYYKMLEGYGVLFVDAASNRCGVTRKNTVAPVYTDNVLSKKDLIENAVAGKVFVSPQVVVTVLAKEEAARLGIDIIVQERS